MLLLLSVITGAPPTVKVALCEALPHEPVVVIITVWTPTLSEPVGTLMFGLSPLKGKPSKVQA